MADLSRVEIRGNDEDQDDGPIDISSGSDDFDFNAESPVEDAYDENKFSTPSPQPTSELQSKQKDLSAIPEESHNNSTLIQSHINKASTPMRSHKLMDSTNFVTMQRGSPNDQNVANRYHQEKPKSSRHFQDLSNSSHVNQDFNNEGSFRYQPQSSHPKNQYRDHQNSTTHSNNQSKNMTTASQQNHSFSAMKLAELDAKYQHLQAPIDRMNLDDIMSQIQSTRLNSSRQRQAPSFHKPQPTKNDENAHFKVPYPPSDMMKTARSCSTLVSPAPYQNVTNLSDAITEPVMSKSCYISVDKPVLAFGFVANKMSRAITVNITNESDLSLWLQPTIDQHFDPRSNQQNRVVFALRETSSFSLEPRSTHTLTVVFEPQGAFTYNGQLRLRLLSKDEPEFLIRMFGYGSRAELKVYTRSFEKIEMGSDGIGVCEIDRSATQMEIVLINKGQRDAFAHVYAVDANDQPMSEDLITITPNRFVVQKSTKEYVKVKIDFHCSIAALTMYRTRSNSQMSFGTAHSTKTLQNETLGRLRIVWGEERLRRRLKTYLDKKPNENVQSDLMQYVSNPFRNEGAFRNEKVVGKWDLQRFSDSVRIMTIQLMDMHVRPQSIAVYPPGVNRPQSAFSDAQENNNQSLANTMAPFQLTNQLNSYFSSTMNEDDTMPIYPREYSRGRH